MQKQTGFTLVELMVSLALGLLIVSAALFMFFSGQKNIALQKNANDLQDDQNFGLSYITKNIRQANLNSPAALLNTNSSLSGIVFKPAEAEIPAAGTTPAVPAKAGNVDSKLVLKNDFNPNFVTNSLDAHASNMRFKNGTAYTDALNDQLVIQYRPAETGGYDCEGNVIDRTDIYVLERYFVRTDDNGGGTAQQRAALACAASRYSANLTANTNLEASNTAGIYGNGQIIMKRVDLFKVRFLVQSSSEKKYMTVSQYRADGTAPRILAVQLGIIARSLDAASDRSVSTEQEFNLFGQTVTQKATFPGRYIRTPIMQTVALRNALGERS